jgi:predicted HAD superfamily hydrolase
MHMENNSTAAELWRQDEILREMGKILGGKQPGIRVVSFDFFDTLVSRLCAEPSDLFVEAGRRFAEQNLLLSPLSPAGFRAARIAADARARENAGLAGRSTEITLADIYAELKTVVRNPDDACRLEFELERLFCYLNPAMASLVQHVRSLGYRTALVSDTYFTTAQLVQLLQDHGLSTALFDAMFVSSERGKAKWNGHLYQELFRQFDLHPSELLHIGDNDHSDIAVARSLGVQAIHYHRVTPATEAVFKSERAIRGANTQPSSALDSLRVLTARRSENAQDPFRDGAMTFGPVLSRFADWSAERFAAAGVRKILALMREGELLGELLQRAAQSAGISLEVVPCYVSRRATALAAMRQVTAHNATALFDGATSLTPLAILEVLGLDRDACQALGSETASKSLTTPQSIAQFLKVLFGLPGLRAKIEARHKENLGLAHEYFSNLIGDESRIGVIDLGWSASIQSHIARILRSRRPEVRTIGCYLACTRRAGRLALEGDAAHAYMDEDWDRSAILPEVAITACVGSTNGYARDNAGKVKPVLGDTKITPEEHLAKARLRTGILEFQSMWLSLCSSKGRKHISSEMHADLDRNSAAILYRLLDYPTKAEADRLGLLRHEENYFGENHSAPLCDERSPVLLRQMGVYHVYQAAQSYWPQGVVARHNPRLVSALRSGWSDPLTLGRLGVAHPVTPVETVLTDVELASLGGLLCGFELEQVVFCGPATPAVQELFRFLWQKRGEAQTKHPQPKLVILEPSETFRGTIEDSREMLVIRGNPAEPSTLRSIRSQLDLSKSAALVLTDHANPPTARHLLNGLGPFLGRAGVVMTACGRFDRNAIEEEAPLADSINRWWQSVGKEIGYTSWPAPAGAVEHLSNWIVFRRSVQESVWNRQWMFLPGDAEAKIESVIA